MGAAAAATPARWFTAEFILYYLVIARAYAFLLRCGRELTVRLSPPGGVSRLRGVRPGLWPGTHVDLSDAQWRAFREALPLLCVVAAVSAAAARLALACRPGAAVAFHVTFGIGYVAYLYGGKVLLLLVLATGSYALSTLVAGRRAGPALIWAANCGALVWVQFYGGRLFAQLFPALAGLDAWRGAARWDTSFNMTMLRMLSFGMDLHWARRAAAAAAAPAASAPAGAVAAADAAAQPGALKSAERLLAETPLPGHLYSLPLYAAYCFYPPLCIAGPIMTFNAFAHQLLPGSSACFPPPRRPSFADVARYARRFCAVLACAEALTHGIHANAVAVSRAWRGGGALGPALTPPQLGAVGYWTLLFMWLKFTAIWRFFRLWSLAAGVAPPENMTRCVNNNYDAVGFWRHWHASFNRWLVRYLYVPLGGARRRALNVWPVFTFVALWHDPAAWRLLGWAWASALLLAPELAVKALARTRFAASRAHTPAFRHARAAAAALNITALMAANLVGFVLGLDGVRHFCAQIFSAQGSGFAAAMLVAFFAAAQVMFEIREGEARSCGVKAAAAALQEARADGKDS